MATALLDGVRVLDLAGEPAELAGRLFAELGADVVKVEAPGGDPLRQVGPFAGERRDPGASLRFAAWNAGKRIAELANDDPRLDELLAGADVVIDTPGWPGAPSVEPLRAPQSVWVSVTPFGSSGPRRDWRASDLGILAASANLSGRGSPGSPPVVVGEPLAYLDLAPEIAIAAILGLFSGEPQVIDLSAQETMALARMGGVTELGRTGENPERHLADQKSPLMEIWPCRDGYLQFGLRGGFARVPTFQFMTQRLEAEGLSNSFWREQDWTRFNQHELDDAEKRALQEPLAEFFRRNTLLDLYELAGEHRLTLGTVNSPKEIYGSSQLASRDVFREIDGIPGFPVRFARVRSADGTVKSPEVEHLAQSVETPVWVSRAQRAAKGAPLAGLKIVEFGAGAAGPIVSRYLAEQGATVVRVESKSRPEFLRMMAVAAKSPHGVEGDRIFNAFNVGKRSVTLNLKQPSGLEVAKRLVHWADGVLENFAPKAMRGFGLDYDRLVEAKPDLVMVSTCINGQTGPHRDYPGFGPQGSALSGYTYLTGHPGETPHSGTVTDFLAPRFAAVALSAGLFHRQQTGRGVYFDLSQVEVALATLAPWLLDFAVNGHVRERSGNRTERAVPHGVFPCAGENRWVAIAAWSDAEWSRLASVIGATDPGLATLEARLARVDEVEALVAAFTRERPADALAEQLQREGVEAVPVADLEDLLVDPQYAARGHFETLEHPVLGPCPYERNGFRLAGGGGYRLSTPLLGEHTREVLTEWLGYSEADVDRMTADGGVE